MSLREKLRVMVVDDTAVSRTLIVQAVEAMGVRHIEPVRDGQAALKALSERPAHLVISDQNMPGISGLELLGKMRASPATAKSAFILITGKPDKELVAQGRALGINNFLAKPFTPKDMRRCIEDVVGPV